MVTVYKINKGINKPIEFKGLKAQYIFYLAIGLVGLLVLFAILYIVGINRFLCILITFILGTALFVMVYRLSDTYGQYGLMKKLARNSIPPVIKASSRKVFLNLTKPQP